ncbi:MAG: rRNA maturation RNase YbeY [Mycoplasmoidaceae bacterium]|nr:rRNA maturation RNase YbeY [Mycoplasmoidaceae bacterium]
MIKYRVYGKINVKDINKCFDAICLSAQKTLKLKENVEFDVNIVSKQIIRNINKQYRHIDKVTDVISFANRDSKEIKVSLLGEIFICLEKAKQQAKEYDHSLQREIIFLFTHGLLHLLGYDHIKQKDQKQMFDLQDEIIGKAKIPAKYIMK